jgi:protease-4
MYQLQKESIVSKINDFFKTIIFISIIIYIAPSVFFSIKKQWTYKLETHNKIGYLAINGNINNTSYYKKQLSNYFKDTSIKAILLKIESDGGAIGSCQALAYDIENLKKEYPKPIISYTENICISGAYQIAAATDYIVATGTAIIGNIGMPVAPAHSMHELIQNCQGIEIESEKKVDNLNPTIDETKTMLQNLSDNTYQQLTKEIASKRHLQLNKIDQWGQGKLFTGQQAYDLKLVDAIGSKTTAINLIKKNIIPSDRKIEWVTPSTKSFIEQLFDIDQEEDADLDKEKRYIL